MKSFLKKTLPKPVFESLKGIRKGLCLFPYRLAGGVVGILPDSFKIYIKSNISVVRPLDCKREQVLLNIDSDIELKTRLWSCAKEPEMQEWMESFFEKGHVFYDIGANIGAYSLIAAKIFKNSIKVYAFEPSFPNFCQLNKNILINQVQGSVVPLQIALSDKTGLSVFHYSNLETGGALHSLGEALDYKGDVFTPVFKQSVLSFALDDMIGHFDLAVPNHLKLDVDGIELKILRGADKTLRNPLLKTLMVEIDDNDKQGQEMQTFLSDRGLKFHSKYKYEAGGETGPASRLFNYLFVRNK